jgi:hypothetical protein
MQNINEVSSTRCSISSAYPEAGEVIVLLDGLHCQYCGLMVAGFRVGQADKTLDFEL